MKGKWYYYILAFPLYVLMLLPFPLLYLISDLLYLLAFYVIGYRKKVVYTNLANSFPGKSKEEIGRVAKGYYRFMTDLFIETFATLTMTAAQMKKRCVYTPNAMRIIKELEAEKRNFLVVMGHWGNWEWGGHSFSLNTGYKLFALYHPVKSPFFNWLTNTIRSKFGIGLINMHHAVKDMVRNRNILSATAFIADQTPVNVKEAYWTGFLNQDTPVFFGTEKIAIKFNQPVVYAGVKRIRRGYYEVDFDLLCKEPAQTKEGEITELHTRRLERDIIAQPETWLWSHRRWKRKRG